MTVKLACGDCLKIMKTMLSNSVDLVLTDIPYGEVNRASGGLRNLDKDLADIVTFEISELVQELTRVCSGSVYVFCGTEQVSYLRAEFVKQGLTTRLGIWEKTNPSPMNGSRLWLSGLECCVFARKAKAVFNEHCKSPVWRHATTRSKIHPTQKPVGLFERLIAASSNPNMTVFDPFMGSGTTGVACININRNFKGIEKDPKYFQLASERLKAASAAKESTNGVETNSTEGDTSGGGSPATDSSIGGVAGEAQNIGQVSSDPSVVTEGAVDGGPVEGLGTGVSCSATRTGGRNIV